MSSIDRDNLRITGKHKAIVDPNVRVEDDVTIVVTQAFCPNGHNLVGAPEGSAPVTFDGYPAVTLLLRADDRQGLVHLSPIHGDSRKSGLTDLPLGTRCQLFCPTCEQELDKPADLDPEQRARYYALYLTPKLSQGSLVMISDVWGHYHSRIIDDFELISAWDTDEPA